MATTRVSPDTKSISICIVEDESIVALDLKRVLENCGYRTAGVFASGEALLEFLSNDRCDLILMDIKISGAMDGIETASKVGEKYKIPVIMLTAFADDSTITRVKEVGPFGYIIKPFEERELKTSIEMALVRYSLETRLYESEERYRLLFEEDLSGDFIADGDGRLVDFNTAFSKMMDTDDFRSADSVNLEMLFENKQEYERLLGQLSESGFLKLYEMKLQTLESRPIIVLANIIAKSEARTGQINEIKGYLIDITDRKSLEQQLRQSQKMEAVGRLAGGVAHDFNNLLTVILGYCSMIRGEEDLEPEVSRSVTGILEATGKASALTRQLLAFSRQQILNPRVIEATGQLGHLDKMLRRLLTDDISFYFAAGDEKSFIYIDPGQLEQVIVNLVVNARDASIDGGIITLAVENVVIGNQTTASTGIIMPGDYVRISVRDTGTGIDPSIVSHIFDPFFTTKPTEKGTGLGLAMVYGIVSQSNGIIDVLSSPGKGSIFSLYFPKADAPETEQGIREEITKRDLRGNETVLLVEDDPKIRDILRKSITNQGYTLLTAANPGEAILILEKLDSDGGIDMVISDLLMPYMNGIELIDRIRKQIRTVKYLLMSGYTEGNEKVASSEFSKERVILKPFSPEELLIRMRQILDT